MSGDKTQGRIDPEGVAVLKKGVCVCPRGLPDLRTGYPAPSPSALSRALSHAQCLQIWFTESWTVAPGS